MDISTYINKLCKLETFYILEMHFYINECQIVAISLILFLFLSPES